MNEEYIASSTIFHTPVGDIEVPAPPIIEDVHPTYKSNLAPLWLVFPNDIFNTHQITSIHRGDASVVIQTVHGRTTIPVTDIDKTWQALQKAFAEGVSDV